MEKLSLNDMKIITMGLLLLEDTTQGSETAIQAKVLRENFNIIIVRTEQQSTHTKTK